MNAYCKNLGEETESLNIYDITEVMIQTQKFFFHKWISTNKVHEVQFVYSVCLGRRKSANVNLFSLTFLHLNYRVLH